MVDNSFHCKKGGIVNICHNFLKREWVEVCGAAHNPDTVTNETTIQGVIKSGEEPPTGGRGFQIRSTSGDTYKEGGNVGAEFHVDTGV